MAYRFDVKLTTAHGSCEGSLVANSVQQISDCLPPDVSIYETTLRGRAADSQPVSDDALFLDLTCWVQQIEYASTMTPEMVAAAQAGQPRITGLHGASQ